MGALRAADGAFLLGIMGDAHGQSRQDLLSRRDARTRPTSLAGKVDLGGSVARELAGGDRARRRDHLIFADDWTVVSHGSRVAMMRRVAIDLPADEARALIERNIAAQDDPELAGMHIVRTAGGHQSAGCRRSCRPIWAGLSARDDLPSSVSLRDSRAGAEARMMPWAFRVPPRLAGRGGLLDVPGDLVVDGLADVAGVQVVVLDGLPARDVARQPCRPEAGTPKAKRPAQGRYSWRRPEPRTQVSRAVAAGHEERGKDHAREPDRPRHL